GPRRARPAGRRRRGPGARSRRRAVRAGDLPGRRPPLPRVRPRSAVSPILQSHGTVARGAFAVAVLVSFVVLFAPPSDVPPAPYGGDKLVPASLFAALAFTGRWAGGCRGVVASTLVLYGAASEVI